MRCPPRRSEPSTWREVTHAGRVSPGQDSGPDFSSLRCVRLGRAALTPQTLCVLLCEMGVTTSAPPNLLIPPDPTQARTRKRRPQHCADRPECHRRRDVCWRHFQNQPEGAGAVPSWVKAWGDWGPSGSKEAPVPFIASNISHQEAAP